MSYDLMVFRPDVAPRTRTEFMNWFAEQTQWNEKHSYDDPSITSDNLKNWFVDMINFYPALNGPYARDENVDDEFVTDYSIGRNVIYSAFSWSLAEKAYEKMKSLAQKHNVGFYDASADHGDILFPDGNGKNIPIDGASNISSIQQIKSWAAPGQENKSVKEILFSKLNLPFNSDNSKKPVKKSSWWKRIFWEK